MSFRRPSSIPRGYSRPPSNPMSAAGSAGGGLSSLSTLAIVVTAIVSVVAVAGVAATTAVWAVNVHTLDAKADANRDDIADLEAQIQWINGSLPAGNGTVFFDDEWTMARGGAPARQFMFNASLITTTAPPTKRNYAWPDADGIVVLQSTLPPPTTTFSEDEFAILSFTDPLIRVEFDLAMLTVTRMYQWPNKNGAVAMLSDVVQIAGNTSVFPDSTFAIENDPDTSKRAMFDASFISGSTNRTYSFPDLDGMLCLIAGNQTLSDKTLDASNEVTLLDTGLALLDDGDTSKQLQFDAGGLATGVALVATLPAFASNGSRELMFTTGPNQLVTGTKTFDDAALLIRDPISAQTGQFNSTLLTAPRDYQFPDASGVLVLEAGAQTLSDKTLDITNTITVLDSQLTIQGDPSNATLSAQFDANNLTQPRLLEIQDADGVIALLSDLPTSGTWAPVFSNRVGWTTNPSVVVGSPIFIRIGNVVTCWLFMTGMTNPGVTLNNSIQFTLPISPGGNFATTSDLMGSGSDGFGEGGQIRAQAGTERARLSSRNFANTGGFGDFGLSFSYRIQ